MGARLAFLAVLLAALVVAVQADAELQPWDKALSYAYSLLSAPPETRNVSTSTTAAELLDTGGDHIASGKLWRVSLKNTGTVDVCVSWTQTLATACSGNAADCDGDDDDGVLVEPGERWSPSYISGQAGFGRLCASSASAGSLNVFYDNPA